MGHFWLNKFLWPAALFSENHRWHVICATLLIITCLDLHHLYFRLLRWTSSSTRPRVWFRRASQCMVPHNLDRSLVSPSEDCSELLPDCWHRPLPGQRERPPCTPTRPRPCFEEWDRQVLRPSLLVSRGRRSWQVSRACRRSRGILFQRRSRWGVFRGCTSSPGVSFSRSILPLWWLLLVRRLTLALPLWHNLLKVSGFVVPWPFSLCHRVGSDPMGVGTVCQIKSSHDNSFVLNCICLFIKCFSQKCSQRIWLREIRHVLRLEKDEERLPKRIFEQAAGRSLPRKEEPVDAEDLDRPIEVLTQGIKRSSQS